MPYIYKSGLQFGTGNITINQTTPIREMTEAQYDALPTSEKLNDTIYLLKDAAVDRLVVDDPAPIGAIMAYGGTTAPTGWLFCRGQAVSRTLYSELFAAIGTTYGSGDGSTTFNLPDLQGNVAVGANSTLDLGDSGGEATHTLTTTEMPSHTHTQNAHNHTQNSHNHTQNSHNHTQNSHNHTQNAHNHKIFVNTGYHPGNGGTISGDNAWAVDSTYTNNIASGSTTATNIATTATNIATTATNIATTAINNEATATNQNTGGGTAHNNMQPYIVTNYIIKAKDNSAASTSVLAMIDFFYPVGSYYETSDTSFNPNVSWGGTWSLETEGQVHVSGSASGTYQVNGARTNTSDGGASTVKLTDAQVAHGHSFTNPTYKATGGAVTNRAKFNTGGMSANATHSHTYGNYTNASPTGSPNAAGVVWIGSGVVSGVAVGGISSTSVAHTHEVPEHGHGFTQPTISVNTNGSVANLSGASSTRTAHSNMQPYIVVNRWHRTA